MSRWGCWKPARGAVVVDDDDAKLVGAVVAPQDVEDPAIEATFATVAAAAAAVVAAAAAVVVTCRCDELSTKVKPSKVSSTEFALCPI